MAQHQSLEYGTGTGGSPRIIFLLGYPHTGTSATHFLLATSSSVSTLGDPSALHGGKEGWDLLRIKKNTESFERWDGKLAWMNWTKLAMDYVQYWNHTKPILLECSPPEIQAPEKLVEAFSDFSVKFLLLVRGDCTFETKTRHHDRTKRTRADGYAITTRTRADGYARVLEKYPKDTFVLRFEDLCLRWEEVYADLTRWEPLLVDVDFDAEPRPKDAEPRPEANFVRSGHGRQLISKHVQSSVAAYCRGVVPVWARPKEVGGFRNNIHPFAEFGYGATSRCIEDVS